MTAPQRLEPAPHPRGHQRVKAESRYPVYDLGSSITVARAIRDKGGGAATQEQLASFLDYSGTNNGAFVRRVAAARHFGLIEDSGRLVVPTSLAATILTPERPGEDDRRAKADAFMAVPLYRAMYERYKNGPLPPEAGLRNALETQFGLPRGQTQKAYRAFINSAGEAGFFDARGGAATHLVMPVYLPAGVDQPEQEGEGASEQGDADALTTRAEPSQAVPIQASADISVTERLRLVLVEKIREIPADNLDTIREYIEEIRKLEADEEKGGDAGK